MKTIIEVDIPDGKIINIKELKTKITIELPKEAKIKLKQRNLEK